MKHPATRALFAYWNDLRGERAAPQRGDIDPAAIRDVLADTFMLDVDLGKRLPFRLAGTRVNGLFDAEQKGRPFLDLWRADERRNICAILTTVADGACPVVAGGVATAGVEGEVPLELLFLPLRHNGKTHARILGLIKPISRPAWLGLLPLGPITLRSLRVVQGEEVVQQFGKERIAVGQQLAATDITIPTEPRVRPPYLRVIQGGLQSRYTARG